MGTDIQWHVERQRDDGTWEYVVGVEGPPRSYHVFNALAGVRQDIVRERGDDTEPFFEPQHVIPDDASLPVRSAWDDGWGNYHAGWRTLAELQAVAWPELCGSIIATLEQMANVGPADRVRAVFWFD